MVMNVGKSVEYQKPPLDYVVPRVQDPAVARAVAKGDVTSFGVSGLTLSASNSYNLWRL